MPEGEWFCQSLLMKDQNAGRIALNSLSDRAFFTKPVIFEGICTFFSHLLGKTS
jgi:hypothetical protein